MIRVEVNGNADGRAYWRRWYVNESITRRLILVGLPRTPANVLARLEERTLMWLLVADTDSFRNVAKHSGSLVIAVSLYSYLTRHLWTVGLAESTHCPPFQPHGVCGSDYFTPSILAVLAVHCTYYVNWLQCHSTNALPSITWLYINVYVYTSFTVICCTVISVLLIMVSRGAVIQSAF